MNKKYIRIFVEFLIIFAPINYFWFDRKDIYDLIFSSLLTALIAMIFVRLYGGEDMGVYRHESVFTVKSSKELLLEKIKKFVKIKNGIIINDTPNMLEIHFGRRYSIYRLLGFSWLSKFEDFIMLSKVRLILTEDAQHVNIDATYEDSMNPHYIRGKRNQNAYNEYFKKIDSSLKKALIENS